MMVNYNGRSQFYRLMRWLSSLFFLALQGGAFSQTFATATIKTFTFQNGERMEMLNIQSYEALELLLQGSSEDRKRYFQEKYGIDLSPFISEAGEKSVGSSYLKGHVAKANTVAEGLARASLIGQNPWPKKPIWPEELSGLVKDFVCPKEVIKNVIFELSMKEINEVKEGKIFSGLYFHNCAFPFWVLQRDISCSTFLGCTFGRTHALIRSWFADVDVTCATRADAEQHWYPIWDGATFRGGFIKGNLITDKWKIRIVLDLDRITIKQEKVDHVTFENMAFRSDGAYKFNGLDLSKFSFINCDFEDNLSFSDVTIGAGTFAKESVPFSLKEIKFEDGALEKLPKDFFVGRDLSGTDFSGKDLSGFDLSNCNLTNTNFYKATLIGTNFTNSNLTGASFAEACCYDEKTGASVYFTRAKLAGASFIDADLRKGLFNEVFCYDETTGASVHFTRANLAGASFIDADLRKGVFNEVFCYDETTGASVYFTRAKLAGASFIGADLRKGVFNKVLCYDEKTGASVYFTRAKLAGASFIGADLRRGVFNDTICQKVNFSSIEQFGSDFPIFHQTDLEEKTRELESENASLREKMEMVMVMQGLIAVWIISVVYSFFKGRWVQAHYLSV